MDLSSLLSGEGVGPNEVDISSTLSSKLPSGEVIFTKPFGRKTTWKTKSGGSIDVSVIFDPMLPYNSSHQIACCSDELTYSLRKSLGEYLVPEKMSNESKLDVEETVLTKMKDILPNDVFIAMCTGISGAGGAASLGSIALAPDFLTRYIKVVEKGIVEKYNEDNAILDAINAKKFMFTYHLAIDSYPNPSLSSSSSSSSTSTTSSTLSSHSSSGASSPGKSPPSDLLVQNIINGSKKKGVLIIHFDADPDRKCDLPENHIPVKESHSRTKKETAALEEVFRSLNVNIADVGEYGSTKWVKDVPKTTDDFFSQVGNFVVSSIDQESKMAIERAEKQGKSMYQ